MKKEIQNVQKEIEQLKCIPDLLDSFSKLSQKQDSILFNSVMEREMPHCS